MSDVAPLPPPTLVQFLTGLLPNRLCLSCLVRLYDQPEQGTRKALEAIAPQLDAQLGECWNCTSTINLTYCIATADNRALT